MKQRTQWIVAICTAASASMAMAADYCIYSERLQPVREQVIEQKITYVQQPVMRTSCIVESPRTAFWSEPSSPVAAVGNVIAAPFRLVGSGLAWTGRTLTGQPSYAASSGYIEPVAEKVTVVKTKHYVKKHHMRKTLSYRSEKLMPVGERFTSTKIIRSGPMLEPVGERFVTTKVVRTRPMLEPVGERFTTTKIVRSRPILVEPVGERFTTVKVIRTRPVLQPVGERVTTIRHIKTVRVLEPVGERVIIRRTYVQPWNYCQF